MLFYLQRSHNRNTIIYDLNTLRNGEIDIENPINVYWIRYEEGAAIAKLSFLQKRVFGVKCIMENRGEKSYILHFNNFNKKEILLSKTETGVYKAFISINHEMAELTSAYIKSENNSLGIPLIMKFIEFYGISLKSGKTISEQVIL
jgi:hypothetical protein